MLNKYIHIISALNLLLVKFEFKIYKRLTPVAWRLTPDALGLMPFKSWNTSYNV